MIEKSKMEIIEELYATHFVDNYASKIADAKDHLYLDDIVEDLYLMICELPESFVKSIYHDCGLNCFRRYISGMIVRQLRSTNSKIYKSYKRVSQTTITIDNPLLFEQWVERSEQ